MSCIINLIHLSVNVRKACYLFVVLQGYMSTSSGMEPDTFIDVQIKGRCGKGQSQFPSIINIPSDNRCKLRNGKKYYIVIQNYKRNDQMRNDNAYQLNLNYDLVLGHSNSNERKISRTMHLRVVQN